jgi:hypothetical protein
MNKRDPKEYLFEFDEEGTNQVSAQIMDSYNSGYMGQDTDAEKSNDVIGTEG